MEIKAVGIDLAKRFFQVAVMTTDGSIASNRKVLRSKLVDTVKRFPPGTVIAMEACATSHHWGRCFKELGYKVSLIPPQNVKAMVQTQKNDANDAVAICEAVFRPKTFPVQVKSLEQQDIKSIRTARNLLVRQRTALCNQSRSLAAEYGLVLPKGVDKLQEKLTEQIEVDGNGLTSSIRQLLARSLDHIQYINVEIKELERQLSQYCKAVPAYEELNAVPGIGPLIAAALISEIGSGEQFAKGRQFSAWLGIVPRQFSSGGIPKLGKASKQGNRELRVLLIHGSRSVIRFIEKRQDQMGHWVRQLIARRGKNKAAVALANKLARICWHMLRTGETFDMSKAFGQSAV